MTVDEKTILAGFLNKVSGYLDSGYESEQVNDFKDDAQTDEQENISSLPLAFQVDEDEYTESLVMVIDAGHYTETRNNREILLLERMLASVGIYPDKNCFIAETEFPEQMIDLVKPKIIVALGKNKTPQFNIPDEIPVLSTYHPAELLEDESLKRGAFEDMKQLMRTLADLDSSYAMESKELLAKYAAADPDFAEQVKEHLT